jgi:acyl-CoA synthetase (AMP-forming)/AMP-acid ligase II
MIVTLHGNGGSVNDFTLLEKELPEFQWHHFDPGNQDWITFVQEANNKVFLVSYSFGSSQLLANFSLVRHKIERVFLVNPYVVSENPLSSLKKHALNLPLIGSLLVSLSHKKGANELLKKIIYPEFIESRPEYQAAKSHLSEIKIWKQAIDNKINMESLEYQKNPHPILGFVYWGDQDQVMTNAIQKKVLGQFAPYLTALDLTPGGHNLLWTEAKRIAKDIKLTAHKIGYFPAEDFRNNVLSYMEKHEKENKDRIALRWADPKELRNWSGRHENQIPHHQISFSDLSMRIGKVARGLIDLGIEKGDRVIVFLPMSLDMYVSMFAIQKIGAIAVFLDSWARSHHLGASAECVAPKAMISFEKAFELVNQVPEFSSMPIRIGYGPGQSFQHRFEDLIVSEPLKELTPVESEFTALITFTTGSTGKPKGANRTHRFLSAQHHALTHVIPYYKDDIDMPAFPIFSLNSLATGVQTVLPALDLSQPSPRDSAILACQILNENVTCVTLSPSMLAGLSIYCRENKISLSGLRRAVTGGAPISRDDVKAFYEIAPDAELWILYGSTEAEPMAHIEGRDMLKYQEHEDPEIVEEGVNVGEISSDIDFKFIKPTRNSIELQKTTGWSAIEVAQGEVGEFICTGDHVCRDYYNNPEAFHATKIAGKDGRVWHRTGDLGYLDSAKNLWIVGRTNNSIERQGKFFFPVRAEVLLKRFDFTYRCAFLGLPHGSDQITCAAIELKTELNPKTFDTEKAKKEIQRVFAKNEIPLDKIYFVESIPMDPRHHSKVEYGILKKNIIENPEKFQQ